MRKRGWLWAACVIGWAWLGCGGDAGRHSAPAQGYDGLPAAGQGGGAPAVGGATGESGATGTAGASAGGSGMSAPTGGGASGTVGGAGGVSDPGAQPTGGTAAPPAAGQGAAEAWTVLIEESWSLGAGAEDPQWCGDKALEEDIYFTAIRPIHPLGTHHTTLSVTPTQTECSSSAVFQSGIIYAAGVGSEELRLPAGVAMKLSAGQVLRLGLHLYNVGDQPLSGVSAVEIIRVDPGEVEHEAELMLSGPLRMMIEPGRQTITHTCNVTENQTLFALFPHMHQLGAHIKTTVTAGGQARVVHDGDYEFEEQFQMLIDPIELRVGDTITTECTYENTTGRTVGFGESSDTEMCFSIFYRYPATGNSFCGRAGF